MKVKIAELTGQALDWAVAQCEGRTDKYWMNDSITGTYSPSTYWMLGGPIIERESIHVEPDSDRKVWMGSIAMKTFKYEDNSPLVAAMRSFVASKLGNDVEVPDDLCVEIGNKYE